MHLKEIKVKVFHNHVVKANGSLELSLHLSSISALDGDEKQAYALGRFNAWHESHATTRAYGNIAVCYEHNKKEVITACLRKGSFLMLTFYVVVTYTTNGER